MAKAKNKTNILVAVITISIVLLIIVLVLLARSLSSTKENPIGTVGNTSGNINNEGLFCEDGDTLYFSNPYDNYYLYSSDLYGENIKKVFDAPVKYINSAGDYLYYNQIDISSDTVYGLSGSMHGIYRLKKNTKNTTKGYDRTVAGSLILIDNYIYYQHYDNQNGMTLYRSSLDGDDKGEALNAIVNPACVINSDIYYPDQDNYFKLNVFDTDTLETSLYVDERMYNPVYSDGYIYYISVGNNYELHRFNFSNNSVEILTTDRVDCFNVLNDTIFYQKNSKDSPALIRMNANGSNPEEIARGNYSRINMTSVYTYYMPFNSQVILYRVPTKGSTKSEEFIPEI